jgi:hypothetical protein
LKKGDFPVFASTRSNLDGSVGHAEVDGGNKNLTVPAYRDFRITKASLDRYLALCMALEIWH